jgi:hypothetical protein
LVYIVQSYAIKKAVETAKADLKTLVDVVFRFDFKGKTEVKGKPFNQFDTGYCTLEDWKLFNQGDLSGTESKGKKK